MSLEVAAHSIHHCLQPAPEPAAGGPHGIPEETSEHRLHPFDEMSLGAARSTVGVSLNRAPHVVVHRVAVW